MALFRRFFYKEPPDGLLEISERVYVFDSSLSSNVLGKDEYKVYLGGIVVQLQDYFPDVSFMVFNFRKGEQRSQISDVFSQYDMTILDYPSHHESFPLLPLEMIHHFLRLSESWLSLEGQQNVLLLHCERGGWPVLAFMLSGLLLYRKQYCGEQKTLEMVYNQASIELLRLSSPINPQPSQLRYLQYISRGDLGSDWPPSDTPLLLDCLILRDLPLFEGIKGCRPILRVYGQDPKARANRSSVLLFSTPKTKKHTRLYQQEECILVKLDIQCRVQGDVVLECIHLHEDLVSEEVVFRIMFHTAFVSANILMVQCDEMDILWDAKDHLPKEFTAEVLFSSGDAMVSNITSAEESFEVEEMFSNAIDEPDHKRSSVSFVVVDTASYDSEATTLLHSPKVPASPPSAYYSLGHSQTSQLPSPPPPPPPPPPPSSAYVRRNSEAMLPPSPSVRVACGPLPDIAIAPLPPPPPPPPPPPLPPMRGRAPPPSIRGVALSTSHYWTMRERVLPSDIILSNAKMQLPDMMAAVLAMDESVLDVDQIENLIKFCPTKKEMEFLKNYTGDKATLGKCEQYFLELMKVPRLESKLRAFSFKIQFGTQITELAKSLNVVNSACEEVRTSQKLKQIMKSVLYLGNTLNRGTTRGAAVGFKLDSLLKLSDTHATNSKMTLMHYLCKALASKASVLLEFHKDLKSLITASKIQLKSLAEEMQAINKGLEKLNQELTASESDGPVSDIFRKTLKDFISMAEIEAATVLRLYSVVGKNADALSYYFGEDPKRYSFEQVTGTLVNFIRLFKKAHEENVKQAELEKKTAKEVEMEKAKGVLHSSPEAASSHHSQTSQVPSLPPPFASVRRNSETMLPPPPPPSPPWKSVYASTFETPAACSTSSSSPPPPPPPAPLPFNSSNTTKANGGRIPPPLPLPYMGNAPLKSLFASASPPLMFGATRGLGSSARKKSSGDESQRHGEAQAAPEFDVLEVETLFSARVPTPPLSPPMGYPAPPPIMRGGAPPPPPPAMRGGGGGGAPLPPPPIRGGAPHLPRPPGGRGNGALPPPPPLGDRALPPQLLKPFHWDKISRALPGSLWEEFQRHGETSTAPEFDVSEIETLFAPTVSVRKPEGRPKPKTVQLIDTKRASNVEIMLTKVKMPLPDMMAAVLAMDESVLDLDQIENLIKFCPTKEEIELLKNYTADKANLGKCEKYFLELMKVPQVESKLRAFSFKIQFGTQITEFRKSLNTVNSACVEVHTSQKLKEIMKKVLYLGNTLNRGTRKGAAVGFKLDSLLKLSDTRATNSKVTLMNYLCKVLASKASVLLDFHKDLESLESASKIQLNTLAAEMQAINKGLESQNKELTASESDGPVSDVFRKTLKDFISIAETEVAAVSSLYSIVGKNADALAYYFGEDPKRCPFEKVTATLLNFIRLFKKAHEENIKQAELEKKKAAKEMKMEKAKGVLHSPQADASLSPPPPPPPPSSHILSIPPPPPPPFNNAHSVPPPPPRTYGSPPPPPPPPPFSHVCSITPPPLLPQNHGAPPPPPPPLIGKTSPQPPPPFRFGGPPPPPPPPPPSSGDEMDILWDAKDHFPNEFKAEVLFSSGDAMVPTITTAPISEDENDADITSPEEFFEVEEIFSDAIDGHDYKRDLDSFVVVDTASDDSEEPNPFLDCASDDSNHNHYMHADTSTDPVKDMAFDVVQHRSDEKADSDINSLKDTIIDSNPKENPSSLPVASPHQDPLPPQHLPPPSLTSEAPPPPPPPPPPPFASERPNGGTVLSPPWKSVYAQPPPPLNWVKVTRALQGSLWDELKRQGEAQSAPEFDVSEIETLFSATVINP